MQRAQGCWWRRGLVRHRLAPSKPTFADVALQTALDGTRTAASDAQCWMADTDPRWGDSGRDDSWAAPLRQCV